MQVQVADPVHVAPKRDRGTRSFKEPRRSAGLQPSPASLPSDTPFALGAGPLSAALTGRWRKVPRLETGGTALGDCSLRSPPTVRLCETLNRTSDITSTRFLFPSFPYDVTQMLSSFERGGRKHRGVPGCAQFSLIELSRRLRPRLTLR